MTPSARDVFRKNLGSAIVASSDSDFRARVLQQLAKRHCFAEEARGGAEALALLEEGHCRTLLLDQSLPDLEVGELVGMIRTRHPHVEVLVLDSQEACAEPALSEAKGCSPPGQAGSALEPVCGSCGSQNYASLLRSGQVLRKPDMGLLPDSSETFRLLQNSREPRIPTEIPMVGAEQNLARLTGVGTRHGVPLPLAAAEIEALPGMTGQSPSLRRVYRLVRLVAARQTPVLVTGETGTGKEVVARALHALSPRCERPFAVVNCAAIPEPLMEAELFGYTRGAFTGAFQSRLGRIPLAQGGTLLLDEVGDLPLSMQAKLLRFLQDGEIQRLGSPETLRVDVRVVAATHRNLPQLVKQGAFREDLYYRLMVFPIEIDPLRLRLEDIPPLSHHFLKLLCQESHVSAKTFSPEAARALEEYAWPGNVRELRQAIERAFILSENQPELRPEHFNFSDL